MNIAELNNTNPNVIHLSIEGDSISVVHRSLFREDEYIHVTFSVESLEVTERSQIHLIGDYDVFPLMDRLKEIAPEIHERALQIPISQIDYHDSFNRDQVETRQRAVRASYTLEPHQPIEVIADDATRELAADLLHQEVQRELDQEIMQRMRDAILSGDVSTASRLIELQRRSGRPL